MDIKLETKFNIYDKVGFVFYYKEDENGRINRVHPNRLYRNNGLDGAKCKELYGEITAIKLEYTKAYDYENEYDYRDRINFNWQYEVCVPEKDGCHHTYVVNEDEVFSRNIQQLSAYSIKELQDELDRRRPSCEDCKWNRTGQPCGHDTGIGRPIEECFEKKD